MRLNAFKMLSYHNGFLYAYSVLILFTHFKNCFRNRVYQFHFLLNRAIHFFYVSCDIFCMKLCRASDKLLLFFRRFRIVNKNLDRDFPLLSCGIEIYVPWIVHYASKTLPSLQIERRIFRKRCREQSRQLLSASTKNPYYYLSASSLHFTCVRAAKRQAYLPLLWYPQLNRRLKSGNIHHRICRNLRPVCRLSALW